MAGLGSAAIDPPLARPATGVVCSLERGLTGFAMRLQYTILYVALIVAVNWGFTVVPLVALPGGEKWPPMSLVVGFVFVARDFAQREIGHRVILAMLAAGAISYVMASPAVAAASVAAFLVSEFTDWAVYSLTKRRFSERVLISSVFATPIDSVVFLYLIGHLSLAGVAAMTASKMAGALLVWWLVRRREARAPT
jgi:uncharacterized PurR-regulated membrane protein YhhQ (DUF165 family)